MESFESGLTCVANITGNAIYLFKTRGLSNSCRLKTAGVGNIANAFWDSVINEYDIILKRNRD